MTKNRPYTAHEREIVEEGAASGMLARQIIKALAERGFVRNVDAMRTTTYFLEGRRRRKTEATPEQENAEPDRSIVVYDDLVLRRAVHTRMALNLRTGERYPVTISLAAGVSFQVPA